ncbi:MAG TPA: hypothetical protein DEH78_33630, partial [Solibacterales bacterium]|nr:hypothetical protein [Bryobacterales bacterium]
MAAALPLLRAAGERPLKTFVLALAVLAAVAVALWFVLGRARPAEVPFAAVEPETIESVLTTNGRVEPVEWAVARAERPGLVVSLPVERGQAVAKGAILAATDASGARAALASAEARIEQARALLSTVERGGPAAERASIDGELAQARLERQSAEREAAALERLVAKQAATAHDLTIARQRIAQAEAAAEVFAAHGYVPVGLDHFALPKDAL